MPKILDVLTLLARDETPPTYSQKLNGYLWVKVVGGRRCLFYSNDDGDVVEVVPCPPPVPAVAGISAEVFISPTGDDDNDGFTVLTPWATYDKAVAEINAWGPNLPYGDIVVHLADGIYAQDANLIFDFIPKGRIVFLGDLATMTVVLAGVATGGSTVVLTDAGAAFGVLKQQVTRFLKVTPLVGSPFWKEIADNSATTLRPADPFPQPILAGDTYEILEPSVIITGDPASDLYHSTVTANLPWSTSNNNTLPLFFKEGPCLILAYLAVDTVPGKFNSTILLQGGLMNLTGVRIIGMGFGIFAAGGYIAGFGAADYDPVFGTLAGDFTSHLGLGVACHTQLGINGLRADKGGFFGFVVSDDPGGLYFDENSQIYITGGACHAGQLRGNAGCVIFIAPDVSLPFLFDGIVAGFSAAISLTRKTYLQVQAPGTVEFDDLGAGVSAFFVFQDSFLWLQTNPVVGGAGDIPGNGVDVRSGSKVQADPAVAFASTGANIVVGTATSTWAGLAPATPVQDILPAFPGSFASVFEA